MIVSKELEEIVLGTFMVFPNSYTKLKKLVKEEYFNLPLNIDVFKAIKELDSKSLPFDALCVVEKIEESRVLSDKEKDRIRKMTCRPIHDVHVDKYVNLLKLNHEDTGDDDEIEEELVVENESVIESLRYGFDVMDARSKFNNVAVKVKRLYDDAIIPEYATKGSAGADLHAHCTNGEVIYPMTHKLIKTGIALQIQEGYEVQIRPRSGLALKSGITVLNAPGTIDSDYRGEVGVILYNCSEQPFFINNGDRIAQMVLSRYSRCDFEEGELDDTERGDGGFGHSGK